MHFDVTGKGNACQSRQFMHQRFHRPILETGTIGIAERGPVEIRENTAATEFGKELQL